MADHSSTSRPYRRDAVPVGPFESEPFDLTPTHLIAPGGAAVSGAEIRATSEAWLTSALVAAGVVLGDYDRTVVGLLAEDGWTTVQVVAGWVARAHESQSADSGDERPESRPGLD